MNHITIRLNCSPSKVLDVELLGRKSGSSGATAHALDPGLRTADVHVALDQVGEPVPHGREVVDAVETGPQPRVGGTPSTRKSDEPQSAFASEEVELPLEQRSVAEP